jgi:hypothetical protein
LQLGLLTTEELYKCFLVHQFDPCILLDSHLKSTMTTYIDRALQIPYLHSPNILQGSPKIIRVTSASYNKYNNMQHTTSALPSLTWYLSAFKVCPQSALSIEYKLFKMLHSYYET